MTEQPPPHNTPSPLLEEAARLASAVQDWARKNLPPPGEGHPDCEWCPLCQFAAVLRGERPELNEKLAEAGNTIVGALRTLLEPGTRRAEDPGAPRVERIDLTDPGEG